MNRKPRTHANSTVNRDQDGSIRYIVVRAEYYLEDVDAHENDENKFTDGVNAKFRFDVSETESGLLATLDSVEDIGDGASSGYDTSLQFMKAIPVAEDAVLNVPGVDEVDSTEGYIMSELDSGRNAVRSNSGKS